MGKKVGEGKISNSSIFVFACIFLHVNLGLEGVTIINKPLRLRSGCNSLEVSIRGV